MYLAFLKKIFSAYFEMEVFKIGITIVCCLYHGTLALWMSLTLLLSSHCNNVSRHRYRKQKKVEVTSESGAPDHFWQNLSIKKYRRTFKAKGISTNNNDRNYFVGFFLLFPITSPEKKFSRKVKRACWKPLTLFSPNHFCFLLDWKTHFPVQEKTKVVRRKQKWLGENKSG